MAEKYRLEEMLGEGGMGRVFRAKHLLLGQDVAIKLLHDTADEPAARARFMREARATMSLQGPHIVRVFDVGVLASNTPYMVLELLQGTDLRGLLAARGALPVAEAVDYLLQICEGLAEAHLKGIVHRDLKPQNLFLTHLATGTPCVKVLDFGVSKLAAEAHDDLTVSHAMIGSPAYVAPEQIRDARNVDARADVWSLGVVLYMLLGGGKPFRGEGIAAMCASIVVDPPEPLRARCPDVPAALEAVVFGCLEKRRERRIPDVAALARELAPFASDLGRTSAERLLRTYGGGTAPRPSVHAPSRTTDEGGGTMTAEDGLRLEPRSATPEPRGSRRHLAPIVLVAGMLAGGIAIAATRAGSSQPTATIPSPVEVSVALPPPSPSTAAPSSAALLPDVTPASTDAVPALPARSATTKAGGERPRAAPPRPRPTTPVRPASTSPQIDRNGVPILE